MKEQNASSEKKKPRLSGEKKFYLFTALGCAAVLLAIIIVAIAVSNNKKVNNIDDGQDSNTLLVPDEPSQDVGNPDGDDEPVIVTPEGMLSPIESVAVSNDYGFFHNQTVNFYYEHEGVDFVATAGTEVKAVQDGVVESIYKDDILLGTEIVVNHGDGLKSARARRRKRLQKRSRKSTARKFCSRKRLAGSLPFIVIPSVGRTG